MEKIRKPFQGVLNIIRFNRHFYLLSLGLLLLLLILSAYTNEPFRTITAILFWGTAAATVISLLVSWYVYDFSDLYKFTWLDSLPTQENDKIVNINAGFDETSELLKSRFQNSELTVLDFYDPLTHTEVSIKRARKVYPPYLNTLHVKTGCLPLADNSTDKVFAVLSAHEIRNKEELKLFFKELNRITKPTGQVIITEHLRDIANFFAYTIGFFHFHSKATWLNAFSASGLNVKEKKKITPFITTFILEKNGIAP